MPTASTGCRLPQTPRRIDRTFFYAWVQCTYTEVDQQMDTTRVNFRLPEELIEKADAAAKATHRNRTQIVTAALRAYLDDVENEEAFREDVVELYLDDEIEYAVLEAFVGRRDAESIRSSKALLDRGEELAEELADL